MTPPASPQPHLFLDRDGTVIREEHYLRDPERVALETGAAEGMRRFAKAGFRLVIVSNQSGIGRGHLTEADLQAVNARLTQLLTAEGLTIASWHHCPHHPDQSCSCRKPGTQMFEQANALCPVDWVASVMVGDKPSDVDAGRALSMGAALVTTGHGGDHLDWAKAQTIPTVGSLVELADMYLPHFATTPQ